MRYLAKLQRKKMITALIGCALIFSLINASHVNAFLGGIVRSVGQALGGDVGKAVGIVGGVLPGGGGPTDQLIGGVVGFPGQMMFGSVIKDFEGASSRSIDKLGAALTENVGKFGGVLSDNLGKADVVLGKRITEIDGMLQGNVQLLDMTFAGTVDSLDQSLQKAVAAMDESFDKAVGGLDTVLSIKSASAFEGVARRILVYGCFLIFLSFAVWQIYQEVYKNKNVKQPALRIAALFCALLSIVSLAYMWPMPNELSAKEVSKRHVKAYEESLSLFDFRRAAHHATLLKVLDSINPHYEGMQQKALVMRDVLLRPATYNSALARSALGANIDRAAYYLEKGG